MDHKYRNDRPNLFCCSEISASPFWKRVLWAAKVAQVDYSWKIGDDRNVRFWEDHWLAFCSLAIQFWPINVVINEQSCCVADL